MTTEEDVVKAVSDLSESGAVSERVALHSLGIGPNDAKVLRFLLDREESGEQVTPRLLAEMLRISSAATTALIDRLADAVAAYERAITLDREEQILQDWEVDDGLFSTVIASSGAAASNRAWRRTGGMAALVSQARIACNRWALAA